MSDTTKRDVYEAAKADYDHARSAMLNAEVEASAEAAAEALENLRSQGVIIPGNVTVTSEHWRGIKTEQAYCSSIGGSKGKPRYYLLKIKKDGTPSKVSLSVWGEIKISAPT